MKKQKKFAFQIGHIEMGKSRNLGLFGGHFEGLRADFPSVIGLINE